MKMSQRDAVYQATHNVLTENGVDFEDGQNIASVMTDEFRGQVHAIVCESFTSGKVSFNDTPSNQEKLNNPSKLSSYVSGLISNWYRKDKRFNGGTTYVPKNPGSRAGQGDAELKALRALHRQFSGVDETKATMIQERIDARLTVIQAEKAKKIAVDLSALPAELIEELGLESA